MNLMKKIILASMATLLLSTSAFANENTGCGLGNQVIQNQDSVLKQVLAVTTNGTFGNQTFGITTGTMGCSKPALLVSNEKAKAFVTNNMDVLAMDISKGQGESLDTLATLLNIKDKASFNSKLQSNFSTIYSSSEVTSSEVIDSIVTVAG